MTKVVISIEDVFVTEKPSIALNITLDKEIVEAVGSGDEPATLALKYALTVQRLIHSGQIEGVARRLCPELFTPLAPPKTENDEEEAGKTAAN